MLDEMFDDYRKVISWAACIGIAVVFMSMSSCYVKDTESDNEATTEQVRVKGENLITLSQMGYNPILVRCAIMGWEAGSSERVCMEAVKNNPGTMEDLLDKTKVITGVIE
jgi:hypothetical protein